MTISHWTIISNHFEWHPANKNVNKIKVLERKEFKKLSENGQIVKL